MKKRFIPKNSPEGQMIQQMLNGGTHNLSMFQSGGKTTGASQYTDAQLRDMYKGSSRDQIAQLQRNLIADGYDPGSIDGVMGPRTLAALKARANTPQTVYGAGPSVNPNSTNRSSTSLINMAPRIDQMGKGTVGTYDDFARNAPEGYQANVTPAVKHMSGRALLKPGVRGPEVEQLQSILAAKGLYKGAIDGVYGPQTRSAVAAFQNEFNQMPRDWNLTSRYKDVITPGQNIDVDGIVGDQTRAALEATTARKPGVTLNPYVKASSQGETSPPKSISIMPEAIMPPALMERDNTRVAPPPLREINFEPAPLIPDTTSDSSFEGGRLGGGGAGHPYQQGGQVGEQAMVKEVLGQFLQTLPPEEQDAFVEEFMALQPQEQQMVVQRIMEMLTQSQQAQVAPGMQQGMPQEMMQEGGDVPSYLEFDRDIANVEVEGGETAMLPDGGLYRFQGAKHSQGGIPTVLPGGSKVFSEYLKVPKYISDGLLNRKSKKRYSYAELSKKFPTSKYEKILMDPNADGYAKRTAEIQLQRNQSMLDTIFNAQEMAKGEAPQEDMSMIDTEQMAMARQGMMIPNGYQYPFNVNFNVAGYGPRQSSGNFMGNNILPKAQDGVLLPKIYGNDIDPEFSTPDPSSPMYDIITKASRIPTDPKFEQPIKSSISSTGEVLSRSDQFSMGRPPLIQGVTPFNTTPSVVTPTAPANTNPTQKQSPSTPIPGTRVGTLYPHTGPTRTIAGPYKEVKNSQGESFYYEYPNQSLINPDFTYEGPTGEQLIDYTIPSYQRSRKDKQGYGEYPVTSEPYMQDFKNRHRDYPKISTFDPNNEAAVEEFQNWTIEQAKKYGLESPIKKVDGKFGQETWSVPRINKITPSGPGPTPTPAPRADSTTPEVAPNVPAGTTVPTFLPFTSTDKQEETKRKNKFGISPKLAGTVLDIGLALNDRLRVDEPDYRDLRKYPIFDRFTDFDNQEISQQQALAIQNIQNSNMPEQVKQSMIANVTASAAQQQGKMDLANQGRYDQWRGAGLNKLQQYLDTNINQQAQDLDKYRREKAQVNYLRDQFNAQRKSRVVNSVRDYLNYMDQVNMANQLKSTEYRINPFTGRVNYTGYKGDPLREQETKMNEYRAAAAQSGMPLQNGATLYRLPGGETFIMTKDGDIKPLNK